MTSDDQRAIGIDIGGTKIAFALANRRGDLVATHQLPTLADEGADAVLARVIHGVQTMLDRAGGEVAGIGVGCPGHVDSASGVVRNAVNLDWVEVDLRGEIRRHLAAQLPVFLQKDANAGALAEMYYGAARGCQDFMYVAVGTGLGGGAVAGGRLVEGATFYPTEIGHLSLNPAGRLCNCGMRGCPEMYVSGVGLLAGWREHHRRFPDSPLSRLDEPATSDIVDAARSHDPLGALILAEAAQWLGAITACCAGILNPALVVIGGGLGHAAWDLLVEGAQQELRRRVLPPTYTNLRLVKSEVQASALGAAALVWHGLSESPATR